MKKIFATILVLLCFVSIAINPVTFTLGWDVQPGIDAVKIYSTNDVTAPIGTWPLLLVVTGNVNTASISMFPQKMFFYATASNFWGESGPSNILGLPPQATNVANVKATR